MAGKRRRLRGKQKDVAVWDPEEQEEEKKACKRSRGETSRGSNEIAKRQNIQRWHISPSPCIAFWSKHGLRIKVIGFYYPGEMTNVDRVCGCGFLGNFFDLGESGLQFSLPHGSEVITFRTAEGAFQATKYWAYAHEFARRNGHDVYQLVKELRQERVAVDWTYGGFGSNWNAMKAVLEAKFWSCPQAEDALKQTGNAFLLEHNAKFGRDKIWSNNADGEGSNWLGMQLMLLRDKLAGRDDWSAFLRYNINLDTGKAWYASEWQDYVRKATEALEQNPHLQAPKCQMHQCTKPTFNREPGHYCRKHNDGPRCKSPGCFVPTWNSKPGEYCSRDCKWRDQQRMHAEACFRSSSTTKSSGTSCWTSGPSQSLSKFENNMEMLD